MTGTLYLTSIIVGLTLITISARGLPFLFGNWINKSPFMKYISSHLPACILFFLMLHSLEKADVMAYPYALPEIGSVFLVVITHLLFRNTLISIGLGLGVYMLLINFLV